MAETERDRVRERERESGDKLPHLGKFVGKKFRGFFFFRFCHFFPMKSFPDQSYITSTKKSPGRKVCPLKTFSEGTLIYVRNL